MKKIVSLFLCIVLIVSLAACGSSGSSSSAPAAPASSSQAGTSSASAPASSGEPRIHIKFGSVGKDGSNYSLGAEYFCEKVAELSNGEIEVEYLGSSLLGGERDMVEGVGLGTFEMCIAASAVVANFAPDLNIFDLPYLVTDKEKAFSVMDGEVGRSILDELKASGIYGLGFWENGQRQLYSNKLILHPEDLKGVKIRTMENDMHIAIFNSLGAYATPIAGPELFTSLQQGVVEAHENPLNNFYTSSFYEVQSHVALTSHVYSPAITMINLDFFNNLSEADQAVILEAEEAARNYERKIAAENDQTLVQTLRDLGIVVSEVDIDEWKAATAPVYEQFKDIVNMDYVNMIRGE